MKQYTTNIVIKRGPIFIHFLILPASSKGLNPSTLTAAIQFHYPLYLKK